VNVSALTLVYAALQMANWQKALDRSLNWVDEHTRSDNKGTKTAKDADKTGTGHGENPPVGGKTAISTKSADKGATQDHGKSKVSAATLRGLVAQSNI
jgi:uncharacterized protein YyaL (SSP411 family)